MKKHYKKGEQLVYDESTKLLTVKKIPDNKFKVCLENNKIYFETIMMLIISIAGIIVSVVGVRVDIVANNISLEEKRIEDLEKQPSFVYNTVADDNGIRHIIENVGGDIKYGNVICDKILIVSIYNENYEYIGKGYIILIGYFEINCSQYNFETKSFEVYSNLEPKPVYDWIDKIENVIISEGYFCNIECKKQFDFYYTDYKKEDVNKTMILNAGIICEIEDNGNYEFKIAENIDELEDERINYDVKEQLELLERYNNSHILDIL